jgi:hypothetical protein
MDKKNFLIKLLKAIVQYQVSCTGARHRFYMRSRIFCDILHSVCSSHGFLVDFTLTASGGVLGDYGLEAIIA